MKKIQRGKCPSCHCSLVLQSPRINSHCNMLIQFLFYFCLSREILKANENEKVIHQSLKTQRRQANRMKIFYRSQFASEIIQGFYRRQGWQSTSLQNHNLFSKFDRASWIKVFEEPIIGPYTFNLLLQLLSTDILITTVDRH